MSLTTTFESVIKTVTKRSLIEIYEIWACGEIGKHNALKMRRLMLVGSSPTMPTKYFICKFR